MAKAKKNIYSPLQLRFLSETKGLEITGVTIDAVCKLVGHAEHGSYGGTGFLIHPRVVLTAGHIVAPISGYASSIDIVPGLYQNIAPFGKASSSNLWAPSNFLKNGTRNIDVGVIILPQSDIKIAPFSLSSANRNIDNYSFCGYVADRVTGDEFETREQVIRHGLSLNNSGTGSFLQFKSTMRGGQSGGPYFVERENERFCYAIHVSQQQGVSYGIKVNDKLIDKIGAIIDSLDN